MAFKHKRLDYNLGVIPLIVLRDCKSLIIYTYGQALLVGYIELVFPSRFCGPLHSYNFKIKKKYKFLNYKNLFEIKA
jgi:hypothetical protein